MTTIAYDGKTIAADSLVTIGNTVVHADQQKMFRLEDGRIVAIAGRVSIGNAFIRWIQGGDKPDLPERDWQAWVIQGGQVLEYDDKYEPVVMAAPCAIGSGWLIAKTAMECGKSAADAVEIAARLDVFTGGPVKTMDV